jgi:DNA-binding GntR family transcriptional regulator
MRGPAASARAPRPATHVPEWARIHAWLRAAILDVSLSPGMPLSEQEIASRSGTSRTPVREALLRLADEDLVEIRPQRGTYVARMDMARIAEALFVREAIEAAVIRRVCALADRHALVQQVTAIVRDQSRAAAAGDVATALDADARFHRAIVEASGLPGVWRIVQGLRDLHHRIRAIAVPELGSARTAVADHRRIVTALRAGDAARATAALAEHLGRNLTLARGIAARHPGYFAEGAAADGVDVPPTRGRRATAAASAGERP